MCQGSPKARCLTQQDTFWELLSRTPVQRGDKGSEAIPGSQGAEQYHWSRHRNKKHIPQRNPQQPSSICSRLGSKGRAALLSELPQQDRPGVGVKPRWMLRSAAYSQTSSSPDFHSLYRHQYLSQHLTDGHQRVGLRTKLISICRAANIPVPEQTASAGDKSRPREEATLRLPKDFGWRLLHP